MLQHKKSKIKILEVILLSFLLIFFNPKTNLPIILQSLSVINSLKPVKPKLSIIIITIIIYLSIYIIYTYIYTYIYIYI